jgi:hypothetical protein
MTESEWLEIHEVCAIHNEIIAESGGDSGILNEGAPDSVASGMSSSESSLGWKY